MKKLFLFMCIVLIALLSVSLAAAFILAPADTFSGGPNGSDTTHVIPPDIAPQASTTAPILVAINTSHTPAATTSTSGIPVTPVIQTPPSQPTSTTPFSPPYTPPPSANPVPTPVSTPTQTPTPTPVPSNKIQWGAYAGDSNPGAGTALEAIVGHPMNLQAIFVGWGDSGSFPTEFNGSFKASGKTLVIFWEPSDGSGETNQSLYNYASITNGNWDLYLSSFAAAAKAYGGPVILIPFAEMNGNWDPWDGTVNGNTPAAFAPMWQHVHSFFTDAPNVKFAWDPNATSEPNTAANSLTAYYPGSAYVDYVGTDGFNFGNPSQSFSEIFSTALGQLQAYNKPIYIFSMATLATGDKAAWITDALTVQIPKYPIAGWIWFNQNKEQNWLINSDPASLSAFVGALPK